MSRYIKLTAAGEELAADAADHQIVRIEHPLLAHPVLVTARFAPGPLTWKDAKAWAEALTLGGFSWRLPTVEEAFFIPDRSKYPAWDSDMFLGAHEHYPWIWTSTLDAEDPAGYAWGVLLVDGDSNRYRQDGRFHALAVRVGQ